MAPRLGQDGVLARTWVCLSQDKEGVDRDRRKREREGEDQGRTQTTSEKQETGRGTFRVRFGQRGREGCRE